MVIAEPTTHIVKVHLGDPRDCNYLVTRINGTKQEVRDYYVGKEFNIGDGAGGDCMQTATRVEFLVSK